MLSEEIKPGLRAALRDHEIGNSSPYRVSFAGKANSGGSFGFMQGDLAAHQPEVTRTFLNAMQAAGVPPDRTQSILARLSVHCSRNPLSVEETEAVNDALEGSRGLVDEMDETILRGVYRDLGRCLERASSAGRTITPEAQIYITLWINMSGAPTELLRWLGGGTPRLRRSVPPAPQEVSGDAIRTYLMATDYYSRNPRNFEHMQNCVRTGLAELG